jgi:quinoprotein glucose dehydrogenase
LEGYRYGKIFLPPGKKTAVELPGFDGGAEWGGPSYDPQTGLLYVNANEMGWLVTMRDVRSEPVIEESYYDAGLRLYNKYCMTCHGAERKSTVDFPILDSVRSKYTSTQVKELLSTGRGRMTSFYYITNEEKKPSFLIYSTMMMKKKICAATSTTGYV